MVICPCLKYIPTTSRVRVLHTNPVFCLRVILPPEVQLLTIANYVGRGLHFRDAIRPTKATQVINTHKPQIPRISTPLLDNSPSPPIPNNPTLTQKTQISQTNSPSSLPQPILTLLHIEFPKTHPQKTKKIYNLNHPETNQISNIEVFFYCLHPQQTKCLPIPRLRNKK